MPSKRYHHTGHTQPSFQIVSSVRSPGSPAAHVNYWSPELERALRDHGVTRVAITGWWKDRGPGLGFLAAFAGQIQHLVVADETIADLSVISELEQLESLSVHGAVEGIDFARLPRLRSCALSDAASLGNVAASPSLRELALHRIGIPDLSGLAPLGTLRALSLRSLARLVTLEGMEALPLEKLELHGLTGLRAIAPVTAGDTLRALSLSDATQVADVERVGEVALLETLYIDRVPELASLAFLRGIARLRDVGVWRTRIRDGDFGVLLELPRLERVREISPRLAHYSHTAEDLSALLRLVWPGTPLAAAEARRDRLTRALAARIDRMARWRRERWKGRG
jgi:hypothetical protein